MTDRDSFRWLSDEEFQDQYIEDWSAVLRKRSLDWYSGATLASHMSDENRFANKAWEQALIPQNILMKGLCDDEYGWPGAPEGMDDYYTPLFQTWEKHGLEKVLLSNRQWAGPDPRPANAIPWTNVELDATRAAFEACLKADEERHTPLDPFNPPRLRNFIPSILCFDTSRTWALIGYEEHHGSVLGATPEFMADFFAFGGGKQQTIERFYQFDHLEALGVFNDDPGIIEGWLDPLYRSVGWPPPERPENYINYGEQDD